MTDNSRPSSYRDVILSKYLATTYAARNDVTDEGIRRVALQCADHLKEWLPADHNSLILEIGCGVGSFLEYCRQSGYSAVTGIDISADQIGRCKALGLQNVFEIDAVDFLRKQTASSFSLIVANDVVEHLPKDSLFEFLSLTRRVLSDGGRMILRVPNLSNPFNLRTRYVDFTHEIGFTVESLSQVLRCTDFFVERVFGEYRQHRHFIAKMLFDVLLLRVSVFFIRHVFHLHFEMIPGKNLVAICRKTDNLGAGSFENQHTPGG